MLSNVLYDRTKGQPPYIPPFNRRGEEIMR